MQVWLIQLYLYTFSIKFSVEHLIFINNKELDMP